LVNDPNPLVNDPELLAAIARLYGIIDVPEPQVTFGSKVGYRGLWTLIACPVKPLRHSLHLGYLCDWLPHLEFEPDVVNAEFIALQCSPKNKKRTSPPIWVVLQFARVNLTLSAPTGGNFWQMLVNAD
jgi:hypothetical protein